MEDEKKQEEQEEPSSVKSAREVAEFLKKENARVEMNIKRLEELRAFETLGGRSEGIKQEEKPQEIDPVTYAKLALEGKLPKTE